MSSPSEPSLSEPSPNGRGVHLIYQYFRVRPAPPHFTVAHAARRQLEYDTCLRRNAEHAHVAAVHVLLENDTDATELNRCVASLDSVAAAKITGVSIGKRMHYRDAFMFANEHLADRVVVVMNADIWLDAGVDRVLAQRDTLFMNGNVLSLTRHEPSQCAYKRVGTRAPLAESTPCGCPFMRPNYYIGSHDSFWFVPPLSTSLVERLDHRQNIWGAEHVVINALLADGRRVLNPSRSVRTYHEHQSALRPWRREADGERKIAKPTDHVQLLPTVL